MEPAQGQYTLAVRQLVAGETSSDVLSEFLALFDGLVLRVKAVYLDRGFYNSTCLGLLTPTTTLTLYRLSGGLRRLKTNSAAVGAV